MIKDKLLTEIKDYCTLNSLDVKEYVNKLLKEAFMKDKYGDKPSIFLKEEKKPVDTVEPEDIKEEKSIIEDEKIEVTVQTIKKPRKRKLN